MDIEKVVGIGITAVVLAVLLRGYRPEIAALVSIAAVTIIFVIISPYLKSVMAMFVDLSEQIGIEMQYIVIVIRVIGVAYIAQLGAEISRDAGEGAIGTKIEMGGKVIIIALSMPVIYKLFEVIGEVINLV